MRSKGNFVKFAGNLSDNQGNYLKEPYLIFLICYTAQMQADSYSLYCLGAYFKQLQKC